jgi:NAD(P)H-dependent FMN reductase
MFNILAISGSLRARSSNTAILRAAALLAPPHAHLMLYEDLGMLPHFNPDLDIVPAPAAVAGLRAQLAASQAVLISAPEYAHGVPGSLKNALDWLVSGVELSDMPVGIITTSPYAMHAPASLEEILRTMGARVVPEASITLQHQVRGWDSATLAADAEIAALLRRSIAALRSAANGA